MRMLLVTEKATCSTTQQDGGAQLVKSLQAELVGSLEVLQFEVDEYPVYHSNRFERRIANAEHVAKSVCCISDQYDLVIIVHVSMAFSLPTISTPLVIFPMFLSPSYQLSGESVPERYVQMEKAALQKASQIITPSYFERRQVEQVFGIPKERIRVIPRGINLRHFFPSKRAIKRSLNLCSVGSIKPQKNLEQLLDLFLMIREYYPESTLKIVGPIQDEVYFKGLQAHSVYDMVEFAGFVAPQDLRELLKSCHVHLSTALCETFGRAVFETLALGMPNIICSDHYAGFDYLVDKPYVTFCQDNKSVLASLADVMSDYDRLSSMAGEVSVLFDDAVLKKCLQAELLHLPIIAVSDFDGTLYHKGDSLRTDRCIRAFKRYSCRVICSARGLDDILNQCAQYQLTVDYIIAYSGAVVSTGSGEVCWVQKMRPEQILDIQATTVPYGAVTFQQAIIQLCVPVGVFSDEEVYQNKAYVSDPYATKLHATIRLLQRLTCFGRVRVFGDGPADQEMITFFDGVLVEKKEPVG